jgi:hypothetical protein
LLVLTRLLHAPDAAAETALRAERELVERQVARGIIDATLEMIQGSTLAPWW